MTPYQRVKGKEWNVALPAFGESVEFKRRTRHKLEMRWERGLFLGVRVETTEGIVGTSDGVYVVQPIRRLPENQRHQGRAVEANAQWPDGPGGVGVAEPGDIASRLPRGAARAEGGC